jgi:hypothetical protein
LRAALPMSAHSSVPSELQRSSAAPQAYAQRNNPELIVHPTTKATGMPCRVLHERANRHMRGDHLRQPLTVGVSAFALLCHRQGCRHSPLRVLLPPPHVQTRCSWPLVWIALPTHCSMCACACAHVCATAVSGRLGGVCNSCERFPAGSAYPVAPRRGA